MGKMSATEKHKKQLERMQLKDESSKNEYAKEKSQKEIAIEELEKQGYKVEYSSGIPMFYIESQTDANIIKTALIDKGSFGFRYPKNVEIV